MEKIKIKIHPTFIIFACLLIYFNKFGLFANYLFVMFIHEFAHAVAAKRLGYKINYIKLIPFGICLDINSYELMPKDEIKIALAGPITNFVLAFFMLALWWIFPASYNHTYLFCYANFITGVFNIVPAFPLDGGRVLLSLLKLNTNSPAKAIKLCKVINILVAVCLLIMFVFSIFYQINLTYLFVIFCVLSGVFDKNKKEQYSFIKYSTKKKIGKILKVKTLCVYQEEPLFKICKHIDNFSYLKLLVFDAQKNVVGELTESEVLNYLESMSATTPFKFVLKYKKSV